MQWWAIHRIKKFLKEPIDIIPFIIILLISPNR